MDAFLGEIRLMATSKPPENWLPCDGRLLSMAQYQLLYAVIGTTFGGNGYSNFALPDLKGQIAIGAGRAPNNPLYLDLGNILGQEFVQLDKKSVPAHSHQMLGAQLGAKHLDATPQGHWLSGLAHVPSDGPVENAHSYATGARDLVSMNVETLTPYPGEGGAHENRQPYLALGYYMCVDNGQFPARP